MNTAANDTYRMQDPQVQGAWDPWANSNNNPDGQNQAQQEAIQQRTSSSAMQMQPAAQSSTMPMRHGLSSEVIGAPISVEEAYQGSLRGMLGREIGAYIAATFLVGTDELVRWAGRLYEVGNNYVVIYQQDQGRYVVGDLNSLRFVEFSESGSRAPIATRPCNNVPDAW